MLILYLVSSFKIIFVVFYYRFFESVIFIFVKLIVCLKWKIVLSVRRITAMFEVSLCLLIFVCVCVMIMGVVLILLRI